MLMANHVNTMKHVSYWAKRAGILFGLLAIIILLPLALPKLLFAYKLERGELSLYSDTRLPEQKGEFILREIKQKLDASPIEADGRPMQIYIPDSPWRRAWLWIIPPKYVGGFVVVPVSRRHAFLSGADFDTNELIAPTGYRPEPPRTLVYYGAHELTHLVIARKVGWTTFYQIPNWINEGLADYVALPREPAAILYAEIGEGSASQEVINTHGVYAPYRLLVTYFLEVEGWSIDRLLECRLTLKEAQAVAFPMLRHQE